jgi:hypothetical protein
MSSRLSALRQLIRETILTESFAGYSPSKEDLDKMPVGKKVVLGADPTLQANQPFVKKIADDTFKADTTLTADDVINYLSQSARLKPSYSIETLKSAEGTISIPTADTAPNYVKYLPTGVKLVSLGDGEFKEVTQMNTAQLIDVMKAYIGDSRNFRFEII